ncbi:putative SPRY domain [Cryptosporidium felis]|nr:putative SPRY domain [Cryptosporidium felis]
MGRRSVEEFTSHDGEATVGGSLRKKQKKAGGRDFKTDDFEFPVFSVRYRDRSVELSEDRLTASGYKGWSTVLLTHGASSGVWYFEVTILEPEIISSFAGHSKYLDLRQKPGIRVGWSCRYSRLDIPVGSSGFGYSLATNTLKVFNNGQETPLEESSNDKTAILPGDVVGCLIRLSGVPYELEDPRKYPHLHPFLELGLLCNPEEPPKATIDPDSSIEFFVNGKKLCTGFSGIPSGFYHPAVSLYMGSKVKLNTGPEFRFYPPGCEFKPIIDLLRPEVK